jgi:hypothetical protein
VASSIAFGEDGERPINISDFDASQGSQERSNEGDDIF